MSQQTNFLKKKVAESQKVLQDVLALADSTSRAQSQKIKELEQLVEQLKEAKLVVAEEVSKEKKATENIKLALDEAKKIVEGAKQTVEEARRAAEEAKKALLVSEESRKDLEAQVDCLEARAKMAYELLGKEKA